MVYYLKDNDVVLRSEEPFGPLSVLWPTGWVPYPTDPDIWFEVVAVSEDKAKQAAKRLRLPALEGVQVTEYNHNHDPEGRFATGSSGTHAATGTHDDEFITSPGAALDAVASGERVTVQKEDVRNLLEKAAKRVDDPDLTKIHVEGMQIFDQHNLGIPREDMPQIPQKVRPDFLKAVGEHVAVTHEDVSPLSLHPSQREISARNVGQKLVTYMSGERTLPPILVSSDNHILDGHHNWGVMAAVATEHPDITMPVIRIGARTSTALTLMRRYAKEHEIANKAIHEAEQRALEFNPNHDALGRFDFGVAHMHGSSAGGAGGKTPPPTPKPPADAFGVGAGLNSRADDNTDKDQTPEPSKPENSLEHPFELKPTEVENFGGGVNPTQKITTDHGEFIFKPVAGERTDLRDQGTSSLAEREVLAARVDRALGMGLTPNTFMAKVNGKLGMAHDFISDAENISNVWDGHPEAGQAESLRNMQAFDYLIGNTDRHMGNAMVEQAGMGHKIWAIDHGYAFGFDTPGRYGSISTFTDDMVGEGGQVEPMSKASAARLASKVEALDARSIFRGAKASANQVEAFESRQKWLVGALRSGEAGNLPSAWYNAGK